MKQGISEERLRDCMPELRKAIAYGKLVNGIDVCKYGKQWVISIESMEREYGKPK